MEKVTRRKIFEQASRKLRQDFEELITIPHSGLKGGEAEKLVKTFLRNHLPKRFDVSSGFIIDRYETVSKQTDVIIYDAINCPIYRTSEEAAIFPSDNVAAVVEVKSCLDKKELELPLQMSMRRSDSLKPCRPPFFKYQLHRQWVACLLSAVQLL